MESTHVFKLSGLNCAVKIERNYTLRKDDEKSVTYDLLLRDIPFDQWRIYKFPAS